MGYADDFDNGVGELVACSSLLIGLLSACGKMYVVTHGIGRNLCQRRWYFDLRGR
jgi:hypothetical protein